MTLSAFLERVGWGIEKIAQRTEDESIMNVSE